MRSNIDCCKMTALGLKEATFSAVIMVMSCYSEDRLHLQFIPTIFKR